MFAIFITTDLTDIWLKDSISDTVEDLANYVNANWEKLNKAAGPNGDWSLLHYEPNTRKSLNELALTKEEASLLDKLIDWKS